MAGPTVAVRGMRVGHGSFVVLEDVDLTVAGGEIVAVTGVNGADEPTWYPGLSLHEHLELVRLTHEPVQGWCLPTDELIEVFGLAGRPTRTRPTCPPASGSGCRSPPR